MYGMLQSVNTLPSVLHINCIIPNNIFSLKCRFCVLFNLQWLTLINVLNNSDLGMSLVSIKQNKIGPIFHFGCSWKRAVCSLWIAYLGFKCCMKRVAGLLAETKCVPEGSCSAGELSKIRKRWSENPFAKLLDLSIRREVPEWPVTSLEIQNSSCQ